jgi:hypothetical protein
MKLIKSQRLFHACLLCLGVLFLKSPPAQAGAAGFQVEGSLRSLTSQGSELASYNFTASVTGCRWIIHAWPSNRVGSTLGHFSDAYDGTNVYAYTQFTNINGSQNTSVGVVEVNDVPYEKSIHAIPIWLAVASSCYLDTTKHGKQKIFFDLHDPRLRTEQAHRLDSTITRQDKFPHLPVLCEFFSDGFYYSRNNSESKRTRVQGVYSNGFLIHRFSAEAFTNVGGTYLPTIFKHEAFAPKPGGATNTELLLVYSQHGRIGKTSLLEKEGAFIPSIDSAVYTEDRRFAAATKPVHEIFYNNVSGRWLNTNDQQIADLYLQAAAISLSNTSATEKASAKITLMILGLILVVTALPIWGLLRRKSA